jgi:hypothetical protein
MFNKTLRLTSVGILFIIAFGSCVTIVKAPKWSEIDQAMTVLLFVLATGFLGVITSIQERKV